MTVVRIGSVVVAFDAAGRFAGVGIVDAIGDVGAVERAGEIVAPRRGR